MFTNISGLSPAYPSHTDRNPGVTQDSKALLMVWLTPWKLALSLVTKPPLKSMPLKEDVGPGGDWVFEFSEDYMVFFYSCT